MMELRVTGVPCYECKRICDLQLLHLEKEPVLFPVP